MELLAAAVIANLFVFYVTAKARRVEQPDRRHNWEDQLIRQYENRRRG